ncbi:MAG: DegV family protein [Acidobacteriota bacterium]
MTDSTADLLPIDARRQGIDVLPVSVQFGSQIFRDGIDLQAEDFHRMLTETREFPRTHPVSTGEFLQAFARAVPSGDIVAVLCSSTLSANFNNAVEAVDKGTVDFAEARRDAGGGAEPKVVVVDSGQCSGPLGLMAVFAKRMANAGLQAAEIAARLEDLLPRFRTLFTVRTIDNLRRAQGVDDGRPTKGRPGERWLLALEQGKLRLVERSVVPEAMDRLVTLLTEGFDLSLPVFGSVVQAAAPAEAANLRDRLFDRLNVREMLEQQIGPAVTSHNGSGTVGAGLIQLSDEETKLLSPKS